MLCVCHHTQFIEALSGFGDLSAASLKLPLEPLAQVQDTDDSSQQVTGHLQKKTI